MAVYILYKEDELDFNQSTLDDVELFESKDQAEQAAYWLNSRLTEFDQQYNGWSVGEARTVRQRSKIAHKFTEGRIYTTEMPDGFSLENVCAYWEDENLQCLKSAQVHTG